MICAFMSCFKHDDSFFSVIELPVLSTVAIQILIYFVLSIFKS